MRTTTSESAGRQALRRTLSAVALPAIALGLWVVYGRGAVSNDGIWYLVRGQELLGLVTVDPSVTATSTPHPISTLLAAAALAVHAPGAPMILLLVAYALTALTLWLIARTVLEPAHDGSELLPVLGAAAFAALAFASRPVTAVTASNASLDTALALSVVVFTWCAIRGRPFGPVAGLSLLAAGLLKPETWPLAALLAAYALARTPRRSAWIVLAASAPLLWALFDWATTGDPMAAFDTTATVERAIRAREVVSQDTFLENLTAAPLELGRAMGPAMALLLVALVPLGARRVRPEERRVLIIVAAVGCAFLFGLTVEALSGKRIVTRYTLPLLALTAVAMGVLLRAALRRFSPARGLLVALSVMTVIVASQTTHLLDQRREATERTARFDATRKALAAVRCSTLLVPSSTLAPYAVFARPDVRVVQTQGPIGSGGDPEASTVTALPEAGRDIVWTPELRPFAFGSEASPVTYRRDGWTVRDGCPRR